MTCRFQAVSATNQFRWLSRRLVEHSQGGGSGRGRHRTFSPAGGSWPFTTLMLARLLEVLWPTNVLICSDVAEFIVTRKSLF